MSSRDAKMQKMQKKIGTRKTRTFNLPVLVIPNPQMELNITAGRANQLRHRTMYITYTVNVLYKQLVPSPSFYSGSHG